MNTTPMHPHDVCKPDVAKADAAAWNADPANASVPLLAMAGPFPFGTYDHDDWTVYMIAAPGKPGVAA